MQANSRQAKGETFSLTSGEFLFYGLLGLIAVFHGANFCRVIGLR
jgi:hypothetical protein